MLKVIRGLSPAASFSQAGESDEIGGKFANELAVSVRAPWRGKMDERNADRSARSLTPPLPWLETTATILARKTSVREASTSFSKPDPPPVAEPEAKTISCGLIHEQTSFD